MARQTHPRENLLRDAVALVPRVQLVLPAQDAPTAQVFAGFRGESLSVYFDEDPVYHFNAASELRRAFVDNRLLEAAQGRLAWLERQEATAAMKLLRKPLTNEEQAPFLVAAERRLSQLSSQLASGNFTVVGEVPDGSDAVGRLSEFLAELLPLSIARSPRVG